MRNIVSIIAFVLATSMLEAQDFKAEAKLSETTRDGFYQIPLKPAVSAYLNTDFSNVRLLDNKNVEVPYLIGSNEKRLVGTAFQSYDIVEKKILTDSCTIVVLANPEKTTINNISLIIKNAEVVKEATLAGSDDKKTWYALKDQFQLGYIDNPNGTSEIQIVDFPNSNYSFYRLAINDKTSLPLNILKAGYYTSFSEEAKYHPIPATRFSQRNDSVKKKTFVTITFDTLHFVDKVTWAITGTPFFLRQAVLYTERERTNKKGKSERYLEYLSDLQLNSHHENVCFLPAVKTNNLLLEIVNDDNPPLVISGVSASQTARHLTAWLRGSSEYKLKFGTPDMASPVYDLEYFRDSIPDDLAVLDVNKVTELTSTHAEQASSSFFTSNIFIWGAILVVGIFLAFMSVKMVRETNAQSK